MDQVELSNLFGSTGQQQYEGDALEIGVRAMVAASANVNSRAVMAIVFLRQYLGQTGYDLTNEILSFKLQQNVGAVRKLRDAVTSVSLREYLQRMVLNVGGGK